MSSDELRHAAEESITLWLESEGWVFDEVFLTDSWKGNP